MLRTTKEGRRQSRTQAFRAYLNQMLVACKVKNLPYETFVSLARGFTVLTLLGETVQRDTPSEDIGEFLRAHVQEIDAIWRACVEESMRVIDNDLGAAAGIVTPAPPLGIADRRILDKPTPNPKKLTPTDLVEGKDFEVVPPTTLP